MTETLKKPTLTEATLGVTFDPVGAGAWSDRNLATLLTIRLAKREAVRFDVRRNVWIEHTLDRNGMPLWRDVPGDPKAVAAGHVFDVAPYMAQGHKKGDPEDDARNRFRTALNKADGPSRYGRLLLTAASVNSSPLRVDAEQIAEADEPTHFWAGDICWDLARCNEDGLAGVLDDGGGLVRSRDHVHFATASCEPNSSTPTPLWNDFLAAVSDDDEEWAEAIMAVCAVALTGYSDRVLPLFWGEAGTGKSFFMVLLLDLLGSYGHTAPAALLDPNSKGYHETHLVKLMGKRGVGVDEAFRDSFRATEHLKGLTGGADVTGAAKYQNGVTFAPTHTLITTSNEVPPMSDPALRERLRPFHFAGDPERVARAAARLGKAGKPSEEWRAERPGVLAQLMARAGEYIADKSVVDLPAHMVAELDEVAAETDPVLLWVADQTQRSDEESEAGWTKASELYSTFRLWCRGQGTRNVPGALQFGHSLTALGIGKEKRGGSVYRALTVTGDTADFDDGIDE